MEGAGMVDTSSRSFPRFNQNSGNVFQHISKPCFFCKEEIAGVSLNDHRLKLGNHVKRKHPNWREILHGRS